MFLCINYWYSQRLHPPRQRTLQSRGDKSSRDRKKGRNDWMEKEDMTHPLDYRQYWKMQLQSVAGETVTLLGSHAPS